jgi:tetratricopeptide (TPR) repeat protein
VLCAALGALFLVGLTLAATVIAAKDRQALDAELGRQAAVAESSARAQRRMRAFKQYAEATDLLMRGQLYDRAAKLLEEANQIDAEFPEAQFALGEAYRLAGLPHRAAPAYLQANDLSQKITNHAHLQALLAAGMAYDGAGDDQAAEKAFILAEREGAGHPLSLVGKAFGLGRAQHLKEAQTAAEEALRQGPHFWETHFACGWVLELQAGMGLVPPESSRARAIGFLQQAQELSPRQAEVWNWLARVRSHSVAPRNRTEALRLFDKAVALEPQNGNRYLIRCAFRGVMGDAGGAAADLQKGRELGASRIMLLHTETILAGARGDAEAAFRLLGQLLQEKQDGPAVVGNWVKLGFLLRRDSEVRPRYEEWCRANPDSPEVYALRAELKAARDRDLASAAAEDRAGLRLAPYHVTLRNQLVRHLLPLGNWQETLEAVQGLLEVAPGEFGAQLVRVRCLAGLGKGVEAKAALEALQKDFPAQAKEIEEARKGL